MYNLAGYLYFFYWNLIHIFFNLKRWFSGYGENIMYLLELYICRFIIQNICYMYDQGPSWPCSYGSWMYNYLCNQCLSPLMLWVQISIRARCTTLCDKVCQWLATGRWFSPGPPVSSTNKTDRHDITEILLKVALKTIKQHERWK
jgi:hypothetical protein